MIFVKRIGQTTDGVGDHRALKERTDYAYEIRKWNTKT